jgi:hypothetical protein
VKLAHLARTAVLLLGVAPAALAQPPDETTSLLARRIRTGDRVWVETSSALQDGRVVDLSGSTLVLKDGGEEVRIPVGKIVSVQRKRNGVLLGTLIGAGVGFGCGLPYGSLAANEGGSAVGAIAFMTAVGAGAGAGLDALMSVRRTVYQRGEARLHVSPIIGPHRVGVVLSKVF